MQLKRPLNVQVTSKHPSLPVHDVRVPPDGVPGLHGGRGDHVVDEVLVGLGAHVEDALAVVVGNLAILKKICHIFVSFRVPSISCLAGKLVIRR